MGICVSKLVQLIFGYPYHDPVFDKVFDNELLLQNVFSFCNLSTIKTVRRVNQKCRRAAEKRFAEISQVAISLEPSSESPHVQLGMEKMLYKLESADHIKILMHDWLGSFRNFKLEAYISAAELIPGWSWTSVTPEDMEQAYNCLEQILRNLWRTNGSLTYSLTMLMTMDNANLPRDLLTSIIEACNSFPHVEIEPKHYVMRNTINLPKLRCTTLRLSLESFAKALSNFENVKKLIIEDATYIKLNKVVQAIIENGEEFRNLEEIDVTVKINFDEVHAISELSRLKRLTIRMITDFGSETFNMCQSTISALEEALAKHAPTLEFLHLKLMRAKVMSGLRKFDSNLKFPKLRELYYDTSLTFVGIGAHDVDIFELNGAIESGNLCTRFPALKKVEFSCRHVLSNLEGMHDFRASIKTWYNEA
ncbi:uncharacterized protein LOC118437301 [Folsomia candida]|uniref:uncharacterized protein LOC118437301 n=1 Tax=Folsomia candida TaxID=158441 RepID=UPI001604C7B0|nr:uncharacterized protein LOC118437301 [Folsomia candida]